MGEVDLKSENLDLKHRGFPIGLTLIEYLTLNRNVWGVSDYFSADLIKFMEFSLKNQFLRYNCHPIFVDSVPQFKTVDDKSNPDDKSNHISYGNPNENDEDMRKLIGELLFFHDLARKKKKIFLIKKYLIKKYSFTEI